MDRPRHHMRRCVRRLHNRTASIRDTIQPQQRTRGVPSVRSLNAGAPVSSSNAITPRDHASSAEDVSTSGSPAANAAMTSGAAYANVEFSGALEPMRAIEPKSTRVNRFCRGSHITLAGLRSRCTYPAACKAFSRWHMLDSICITHWTASPVHGHLGETTHYTTANCRYPQGGLTLNLIRQL